MRLRPRTIHAILGENGSGKSTLVKLLSGVVPPSRGAIRVDGRTIDRFSPTVFQRLGLATVFQEVLIAPDRSALDNIFLGYDGLIRRRVPRARRAQLAAESLSTIAKTKFDLDTPAGRLPLAARQLVVLARALVRRPRMLILDEVTAALDFADRESVFQTMEAFSRAGGLILFISHRMDEVLRLAHRVTILRNGRVVDTLERASLSSEQMLSLMAPAAAAEIVHGALKRPSRDERLLIEGLTLAPNVPPIDDKVRAGEIVGLAGLDGHGQEAFLEALCGLRSPLSGRLMVEADGRWVAVTSFRQAVRSGVAYLARDRRANGIFPSLSILDNFALVSMDRDRRFGLIDRRKQRARYETYRRRLVDRRAIA